MKNAHEPHGLKVRGAFLMPGGCHERIQVFLQKGRWERRQQMPVSRKLDTYGCGCAHDCGYCYAKSLLDFRGLWHPEDPSVADIGKIRKKLDKVPVGTVLRLGGMTDCFQPAEKKHRVTYDLIRELNRRRIGYLIVTKSALVADDEYIRIYDPELAHIQVTITATDDEKALEYEKASRISERIAVVEKLQDLSFDVSVRLSPS